MLFDIRGRRRSVIKFVYGGLAILFAVGFVGFGVGSDVGAGVLGSGHGGGGGGHGGDGQSADDQIEDLRERVADNPRAADAWRRLSLLEASEAFEQTGGHGGGTEPADDAAERLNLAVAAFEEYLDLVGRRRVEPAVAGGAARSYIALGMLDDAIAAQRLAIRDERDPQGWFLLAQYAAAANDDELVDRAMSRAIRAAPRGQRETLRAQRVELRRQAFTVSPPAGGAPAGGPPAGGHGG